MRRLYSTLVLMLLVTGPVAAQDLAETSLEARVWLDRGDNSALHQGDDVRVYYRTSFDAYAAIFRIDTDGRVSLLMPAHPGAHNLTSSGREYRLLMPGSARWEVRDDPGVGYFFIVAAPQQLDFSAFQWVPGQERWDLGSVGGRVYEDPYLAIDDFVAALIPNWDVAEYTLDFLSYDVGESHDFPRFLCYDCHGYRPYYEWNPYTYACASFRVVIWDDPYFYPAARYSGTRVVYTVPVRNRPRYTVVARGPSDGWSPIVRTRSAPPVRVRATQYKEPAVARGGGRAPARRRPSSIVQPTRATASATTTARAAKPRGTVSPTRSGARANAVSRPAAATPTGRSATSARNRAATPTPVRSPAMRSTQPVRRPVRSAAPSGSTPTRSATGRPSSARPSPSATLPARTSRSGSFSLLRRLAGAVRNEISGGTGSRPSAATRPPSTARPQSGSSGTFRTSPVVRSRPSIGSTAPRPTNTPTRARSSTPRRPPARATPSRAPTRSRAKPPVRRRGGRGG